MKPELLLPAGNKSCLRAAVNNGADAVYLGLQRFNARRSAGNFSDKDLFSIIGYAHQRNVKVYVALNILVKNSELVDYFDAINLAYSAKADAVIIADPNLIPAIKKNFPKLKIHLSTQATITNTYSIPKGADRVILPRELSLEEIKAFSKVCETEIFVHGALCFSYSGQCLFSSIVGGRSGNRGLCAQPCRKIYNNKYLMSTMDLCMLEKLPELIDAGVKSFKIEGRMRSPQYVGTVSKIYRKYINHPQEIEQEDLDMLKIVFNREFTSGFAFNKSITDTAQPMNRGLYIGNIKNGKLKLKKPIKKGDGIAIWTKQRTGFKVDFSGEPGDIINLNKPDSPVYKTYSVDLEVNLGDEIKSVDPSIIKTKIVLPEMKFKKNTSEAKLFVKCYNQKSAQDADRHKADLIYYDILKEDCEEVKKQITHSKFFVYTPRILNDKELINIVKKINKLKPDGVLVGNRGLISQLKDYELHLDYSFNTFNDIDIKEIPIISPELSFEEISNLKNKNIILLTHGDLILMNTKEPIKAPELIDEQDRHFQVRNNHGINEILNCKPLGLFNQAIKFKELGIKYFFIDTKEPRKFIQIYRDILSGKPFDDKKLRKGHTSGYKTTI
jgi:collagenase-like PrtC family protease